METSYEKSLAFLKRYERPLATFLFVTGFIGDLLTFGLLDLPAVTALFAAYLGLVIIATVVAHAMHGKQGKFSRALAVLAPLFAQFVFGSLLSGFLIFYTKSAVLSVSWPFLILLGLVFFGNEIFRNYREQLIFQTFLVYFSIYAFIIFALPLYLNRIGKAVFLESTALSVAAFALYLLVLFFAGKERLKNTLLAIVVTSAALAAVIVGSYLAGLLPPIPLTLKAGGVYHSLSHEGNAYVVKAEASRHWWDPRAQLVHHAPGTPLYAYSAIFAPGAFSASIMHVWQHYDEKSGSWKTESTVAFGLSGGRAGGYRGYSIKDDPEPGRWRVLVQTIDGQTIGKFNFTVQNVPREPAVDTLQL